MAGVEKYTTEQVAKICAHNGRVHIDYSNSDIDKSRSKLNYKMKTWHELQGIKNDYDYFQKVVGENYLYGRGSKREEGAVTAASWVITCPKEIIGSAEKEKTFFQSCFDFCESRYGAANVISATVHYDEGGAPHMHYLFVPVTDLDHDRVHYKTKKTKQAVRMESGRYEFGFRYVLDKNGEKIPVKNCSKMTDYYDKKISGADVLNKYELQHFHSDLQTYLDSQGIEGRVLTGTTGGMNMSVSQLKEFTAETGLRIDEVKDLDKTKTLMTNFVEKQQKTVVMEETVRTKDKIILQLKEDVSRHKEQVRNLSKDVFQQEKQIGTLEKEKSSLVEQRDSAMEQKNELQKDLSSRDQIIQNKEQKIENLSARVDTLEEQIRNKDTDIRQIKEETVGKATYERLERDSFSKDKTISSLREKLSESRQRVTALEHEKTANVSADRTEVLTEKLSEKERELSFSEEKRRELEKKVASLEEQLGEKIKDLDAALSRVKELEAEKVKEVKVEPEEKEKTWGFDSSWGKSSGWGSNNDSKTRNTEIIW